MISSDRATARSKFSSVSLDWPVSEISTNKHIHVAAERLLVQQRDILVDDAGVLKRAHTPKAGGGGQAHLFREIRIGDAAVGLQRIQDLFVETVEFHNVAPHILLAFRAYLAINLIFCPTGATNLRQLVP